MSSTIGRIEALDFHHIARRPLQAEECALAIVDIQEKLLPPIFNNEALVRNTRLLIHAAKILDIPVLVTTQYAKGLGGTVPEIAELVADVQPIDKTEFSCFGRDEFCSAVKSLPGQRTTMLLCGMEAHICVMQTALAALDQGYIVHVASDAIGSRHEWNWQVGLERMQNAGAVISSTEMMIYELMRKSGTPQFKELLQHIK
ncbi:MAG TPA: hydrolase [Clostridia bacterium]|nr:hydrolase [Clostridia bacterium]